MSSLRPAQLADPTAICGQIAQLAKKAFSPKPDSQHRSLWRDVDFRRDRRRAPSPITLA